MNPENPTKYLYLIIIYYLLFIIIYSILLDYFRINYIMSSTLQYPERCKKTTGKRLQSGKSNEVSFEDKYI